MWLKNCILLLFAVYSAHSVEIVPFQAVVSVSVGSRVEFNCTSPNSVTWEAEPRSAIPVGAVKAIANSPRGDNINTLVLENVTMANSGTFRCIEESTSDSTSFRLNVFSVTTKSASYVYKDNSELGCRVNDDTRTFTYTWKKGSTPVKDLRVEEKQEYREHENGTLEIIDPSRTFAGMYTCVAEYEEDGSKYTVDIDVPFYAQPHVLPFEKSKNLVQDEKMVVECKVLGYPKPYITWFKEDEEIVVEEGSHYKLSPANTYDGMPINDARLQIDSVGFDDAAEYKCMARMSRWPTFNSTQVILVRVKDKLAALWPFLGIVAEVVILCTIIFIYEKKRNKDAAVEEEADQDGAVPEKKSENVRHRGNSNNPRA